MSTYVPPTNPSPELQTVLAWIDATNTWPWDVSAFAAQISDDEYHHTVLPSSLGAPEIKSKAEWVAGFEKGFLPLFESFEASRTGYHDDVLTGLSTLQLKVHEIIEAPEGRVIAHVRTAQYSTCYKSWPDPGAPTHNDTHSSARAARRSSVSTLRTSTLSFVPCARTRVGSIRLSRRRSSWIQRRCRAFSRPSRLRLWRNHPLFVLSSPTHPIHRSDTCVI